MAITLALYSPSPRLGIWGVSLELMGRGSVSWTKEVSLHFGVRSCVCVRVCVIVCVALPMVAGVLSMARVLRWLFEYY